MNKTSLPSTQEPDFWAPRPCFRDPIPEIFEAAQLLNQAVDAHLKGRSTEAGKLLMQADMSKVRAWLESIWGKGNPEIWRIRKVESAPKTLDKNERDSKRKPSKQDERALIERDGYQCRFCGIPVIRSEVRIAIRKHYPDELNWGRSNSEQHAAFQCMWVQYDHILPHSRGGRTDLDNLAITCSGCNYGRGEYTLEEVGLIDPRTRPATKTDWDGLERFLKR